MGRRSPLCIDGLGCRTPRSLPARFRPRSLRDGGHLDCTAPHGPKVAAFRPKGVGRETPDGDRICPIPAIAPGSSQGDVEW